MPTSTQWPKERVEIGSLWRHKNGRYPHVRYRVIARGTWRHAYSSTPWVQLEREDLRPKRRRSQEPEGWLLNKLEQVDA